MDIKTTPAHRIGESLVRVVDKNGNPLSDKEFVLNQKSHQFLFGSGAFDFLEYEGKKGDPDSLLLLKELRANLLDRYPNT